MLSVQKPPGDEQLFETCREFKWNKLMRERCTSRWLLSRLCITMNGSENVRSQQLLNWKRVFYLTRDLYGPEGEEYKIYFFNIVARLGWTANATPQRERVLQCYVSCQ
jgi:hypothetical protein